MPELKQEYCFLNWEFEGDAEPLDMRLDEVSENIVLPFSADETLITNADAKNKKLLRGMFNDWPEMAVLACREVFVVERNGSQRNRSGGVERMLYRSINIIEVSCMICVEYCRVGTTENILRANKAYLQFIMIVAVLLRKLTEIFLQKSDISRLAFTDPKVFSAGGTTLSDFLPGFCNKKRCLAASV